MKLDGRAVKIILSKLTFVEEPLSSNGGNFKNG
jgi:hypothetical protein